MTTNPRNWKSRCTGHKANGDRCGLPPIAGTTVCRKHGGAAPQVAAKAAVRAAVMNWGLGDVHVDPGETLLMLVAQSADRVRRYAREIADLVAESPRLRDALVGESWVVGDDGQSRKAGEYIRGLVRLEMDERKLCGHFSKLALDAGIAARQVELAERFGSQLAEVLRLVFGDPELGLTEDQRRVAPLVARRHLEITG